MRLWFLLAGLLILSTSSTIAQNWYRLGANNYSIASVGSSSLVVAGQGGSIIRSDDGGATWIRQTTGIGFDLTDIVFNDPDHGIAVGDSGVILITGGDGESWQRVASGTERRLARVAINGTLALAVGQSGTIVRSTDGGITWKRIESGTTEHLLALRLKDEMEGIALGVQGGIYRTTDGGIGWTRVDSSGNALWDALYLGDGEIIAVGNRFATRLSHDGGATWSSSGGSLQSVTYSLRSILSADNGEIVAVGFGEYEGNVWRSTDRGASWILSSTGAPKNFYIPLRTVVSTDDNTLWAVGDEGLILFSIDRGLTWEFRSWLPLAHESKALGDVLMTDIVANSSWRIGGANIYGYFLSDDSGTTWRKSTDETFPQFTDLHFFDSLNGVAVGGMATYYETTDGGRNWERKFDLNGVSNAEVVRYGWNGVTYFNRTDGILYGDSNWVYVTGDGGETWMRSGIDTGLSAILDVLYADSLNLVLSGVRNYGLDSLSNFIQPDNLIYRSTDGGRSWDLVARVSRPDMHLQRIGTNGPEHWQIGYWGWDDERKSLKGGLFETRDGGDHWDTISFGYGVGLHGVRYFDERHGYAYGSGIWRTDDGGETWERESLASAGFFGDSINTIGTGYLLDIELSPDRRTLVASGYGVALRKNLTSPISSVHQIFPFFRTIDELELSFAP